MGLLSDQLIGARAIGGSRGGGRGGSLGSIPTAMHVHGHTPSVMAGSMTTSSSSGSGGHGGMILGHGHGHHPSSDPTSSSSLMEGGVGGAGNAFDPSFMPIHRPLSPTRFVGWLFN